MSCRVFEQREFFPFPLSIRAPARGAHGVVVSCCRPKTKGASRGRARRRCAVGAMAPLPAEARLRGQKSRCWRRTPAHRRPRTGFPSSRARRRPPACTNVRSRGSRCRPQQRTPWRILGACGEQGTCPLRRQRGTAMRNAILHALLQQPQNEAGAQFRQLMGRQEHSHRKADFMTSTAALLTLNKCRHGPSHPSQCPARHRFPRRRTRTHHKG